MLKTEPSIVAQVESPARTLGKPWQRGAPSPNPGGRPKKTDEVRIAETLARQHAPAAMRALIAMIEDANIGESTRLRAIELLLDRALGKPGARDRGPAQERTYVVQQLVANPPPGGFPGVLCHPDPRWIAQSTGILSPSAEVIDVPKRVR